MVAPRPDARRTERAGEERLVDMRAQCRRNEESETGASPKPAVKAGDALFRAFGKNRAWVEQLCRSALPPGRRRMKLSLREHAADPCFVKGNLEQRFADLLWLAETALGRDMMLLVEHQSAVDEAMMRRLMEYRELALAWYREQHPGRPDPIILQVVVYTGRRPWRASLEPMQPEQVEHLMQAAGRLFGYVLVGVAGADDGRMRAAAPDPAARALLRALTWRKPGSDAGLREILRDLPQGSGLGRLVLVYLMGAKGVSREQMDRCYNVNPHLKEVAMTILEEAGAKTLRSALQRLLARRFGDVPEQARAQIEAATLEQLDGWLDEVLEADSVDAVLENGANGSGKPGKLNGSNGQNGTGGAAH